MITHTTATLGGKLANAIGLKTKRIVLAPVEQIFGRLKDMGSTDKLPALIVDRKGLSINRENIIRSGASRAGFRMSDSVDEGTVKILHCLPIRLSYEVGIVSNDRDLLDKAEVNLLWFLEEMGGDLDVTVELQGIQFTLPIQVVPTVLTDGSFDIERSEDWEESKFFKMVFSLECKSFALRASLKPAILNINYSLREDNGLVLLEGHNG